MSQKEHFPFHLYNKINRICTVLESKENILLCKFKFTAQMNKFTVYFTNIIQQIEPVNKSTTLKFFKWQADNQ